MRHTIVVLVVRKVTINFERKDYSDLPRVSLDQFYRQNDKK